MILGSLVQFSWHIQLNIYKWPGNLTRHFAGPELAQNFLADIHGILPRYPNWWGSEWIWVGFPGKVGGNEEHQVVRILSLAWLGWVGWGGLLGGLGWLISETANWWGFNDEILTRFMLWRKCGWFWFCLHDSENASWRHLEQQKNPKHDLCESLEQMITLPKFNSWFTWKF